MNEEEVQTALSCAPDEVPKAMAKLFSDRAAQTVFSYKPYLSNTAIRVELRTKNPNHDQAESDQGGHSTTIPQPDEYDGGGGGTDAVEDDNGDLPAQTYVSTATLYIDTGDEGGETTDPTVVDAKEENEDSNQLGSQPQVDLIGPGPASMENISPTSAPELKETGSNMSSWESSPKVSTDEENSTLNNKDADAVDENVAGNEDQENPGEASVQTGIVCGTGTEAPNIPKVEEGVPEGQSQETSVQTKFGGYPPDQSDTLIVQELQNKFPVHSQDDVIDDAGGEGVNSTQRDEDLVTPIQPDDKVEGTLDSDVEETVPADVVETAENDDEDTVPVDVHVEEAVEDNIEETLPDEVVETVEDESKNNPLEENANNSGLPSGAEAAEPPDTDGVENIEEQTIPENATNSGAQTVFTYDPMMSNSQLVDELANAYPKHSKENGIVPDDTTPVDTSTSAADDDVVASSNDERQSIKSVTASGPNMVDEEQIQADDEMGGEEETIKEKGEQTGIVLGIDKTRPGLNTTENVEPEKIDELREKGAQTVFGGYDIDQSDTKIIEELQFNDPVHSQMDSLNPIDETDSKPVEASDGVDTEEVQDGVDAGDQPVEVDGYDALPDGEVETAEGDVTLDEDGELIGQEDVVKEGKEDNADDIVEDAKETSEGDKTLDVDPVLDVKVDTEEESKEDDTINPIEETRKETIETSDLETDDGTGVQTMLTCATSEESPSKVTRYAEQITQTVFSYNPDISNTKILDELKTKEPQHDETGTQQEVEVERSSNADVGNADDEEAVTGEKSNDEMVLDEENADSGRTELVDPIEGTDVPDEGEGIMAEEGELEETNLKAGAAEDQDTNEMGDIEADATDDKDTADKEEIEEINKEKPLIEPDAQLDESNSDAEATEPGIVSSAEQNESGAVDEQQLNEGIQTNIVCGIGSEQLESSNEKTQQTFYTYDSRVSDSKVIPELQAGYPVHSQLAVENVGTKEECKGPCNKLAKSSARPGVEEDGATPKAALSTIDDSENEDNDNYITTTEGERTDDEMTDASALSDVEMDHPELKGLPSRQGIDKGSKSVPAIQAENEAKTRLRAESYPVSSTTKPRNLSLQDPVKKSAAEEQTNDEATLNETTEATADDSNVDQLQERDAQTHIIFGTGSTPLDINDKASNTYFTYDANCSDSKIIDELQTRDPIHSQNNVSFTSLPKKSAASVGSLFNDDWEKNESSGEGEIEVREIDTSHSKASNWLQEPDRNSDLMDVSDIEQEDEDTSKQHDIDLTLVIEDEEVEDDSGKSNRRIQTTLSFGDTPEKQMEEDTSKTLIPQQSTEPSLSVHIMFNLQVGNSTNTMQMSIPQSDLHPTDQALTATFNAEISGGQAEDKERLKDGNEKVRCTLPILVTVTCEKRIDGSGNVVLKPVVELMFQRSLSNAMLPLEDQLEILDDEASDVLYKNEQMKQSSYRDSVIEEIVTNVPEESDKKQVGIVLEDIYNKLPQSDTNQDELYKYPGITTEGKREIEIQTDLVLGALLFSKSISSVGEDGFETASEGQLPDEELMLPNPPMDEPSSSTDVSWAEGSSPPMDQPSSSTDVSLAEGSSPPMDQPSSSTDVSLAEGSSPPMDQPSSSTDVSWAEGSLSGVENAMDYDDLKLLVGPNDACNQQYVQKLAPTSQDNLPLLETSKRNVLKISTAEMLDVPDKVSSLVARNTDGNKTVGVTGHKLHRWGFPNEHNSESSEKDAEKVFSTTEPGDKSLQESKSGRILSSVATRIIFEFQSSQPDFESVDGRAPGVKSKIAFQILESREQDKQPSHVATLDLKESTAPSKIMYMVDGEVMSKVLVPQGSPLELNIPFDGEPFVLKLPLPNVRPLDESNSTATAVRKVPFTIAKDGDETLTKKKDLERGGSPIQFTIPLGDGHGIMTVTAKIEDDTSDQDFPEVITMMTTFDERISDGDLPAAGKEQVSGMKKESVGKICDCKNRKLGNAVGDLAENKKEDEKEKVIPLQAGGKSKTVTAMFIKDGVPGEKQTKVLRPGGSPLYVNMPSTAGVPVRARLALNPSPDDEETPTASDGLGLKTKVSCKIIQDGVEKETKTKLMEAGGSQLRFDLPLGKDGHLMANILIPNPDDAVSANVPEESDGPTDAVTEKCICQPVDKCVCEPEIEVSPAKKETERKKTSGDRCFDVITEALATYAREIDPLRRALEEITEKVKELNMPELAGIGEPPGISYHSLDMADSRDLFGSEYSMLRPPPIKITLRTGTSRISTTIHSRPNTRQRPATNPSSQRRGMDLPDTRPNRSSLPLCQREFSRELVKSPRQRPTRSTPCSIDPGSYQNRCPLAPPTPNEYQNEQPYVQQQQRSSELPTGYIEHSSNRCPLAPPTPKEYQNEQPHVQQQQRSSELPTGYVKHSSNRCPFASENFNVQPRNRTSQLQTQMMQGYPGTQREDYNDYTVTPSMFNIRSRVYVSPDTPPRSRERNGSRCNGHCYNPDTGYDDYTPQTRSPIAEMYIKLSQNSRSTEFYEEDEDSLFYEDDEGYGYQRGGQTQQRCVSQRNPRSREKVQGRMHKGRDDDRNKDKGRGTKGCACGVSSTSLTAVELAKKESYWCDPEDVIGSTRPGNLGNVNS